MINYNNSKIYKIVCNNTGLTYYGSTTQKYLSARLDQHRQVYRTYTSRKIINGGNYDILLVENVNCNSKDELRARERFYIENNECVNKQIPGRTYKEWCKVNKEKLSEQNKKYRLDNKEKILKYYQENKDKLAEKRKVKITCSCGSTFRKKDKARHERTQKHLKSISN